MKKLLLVAFALLLLAPVSQAGNFYVGASYLDSGLDINVENSVNNFNESDSGYKFYGGFNFLKFLGVEAGYYDMGNPAQDPMNQVEITAWNASVRGILPLGPIQLFAKAGYFKWDADVVFEGDSFSDDDNDFGYGAGISFVLFQKLELRAEYEVVDISDADLDVISAGVAWRF